MLDVMVEKIEPLFSTRRMAEYFDVDQDTVLDWWHAGKIPPPDHRMSARKIYWKPETINPNCKNTGCTLSISWVFCMIEPPDVLWLA